MLRGADKSLARPGRKQATATEDLIFIYPIYNHNWRNISTIYIYIYIYTGLFKMIVDVLTTCHTQYT